VSDPIGLVVADAGYWSKDNASADGADCLIAITKDWKQRQTAVSLAPPKVTRPTTQPRSKRWDTGYTPKNLRPPTRSDALL
jgi:hypothetical protein